jgi:hypothetical protein
VRAGIGGLDNGTILNGGGTGPASIAIGSVPLALIKQARDLSGTVLPNGSGVAPEQELWFVLRVDNPTAHPADGVRILDVLDENQFEYVANTLEQCTVPAGATDAVLWSGPWATLTDSVGAPDDAASVTDAGGLPTPERVSIGSGPGQPNQSVTVPPGTLRAFRFRVRVL